MPPCEGVPLATSIAECFRCDDSHPTIFAVPSKQPCSIGKQGDPKDATACGLIVLFDNESTDAKVESRNVSNRNSVTSPTLRVLAPTPTAIPLRSYGKEGRLFLPFNAALNPALAEPELAMLLPSPEAMQALVWLPSIGLVGLESNDAIRLTDIFLPPPESKSLTWQRPPNVYLPPKTIREFSFLHPPTAEELLSGNSSDISDPTSSLTDLEDTQHKGILGRLLTMLRGRLVKWQDNAARKQLDRKQLHESGDSRRSGKPAGASSRAHVSTSMTGKLADQIRAAAMSVFSGSIKREREAQIEKLLRVMQRDPDRALKFAIPMGNLSAMRGIAESGTRLMARSINFTLSGLFGNGQVGSVWNIEADQQARLYEAYRKQAEREMSIGRYDRAAYIFAHLLGDLSAAAGVLEKGKRFSEAAVLYKQLQRLADSARCLELAGRLAEAAEQYEQCQHYVKAAELWNAIDKPSKATAAIETAISQAEKRGDKVQAARLIKEHLGDSQRAEDLLWSCWPDHGSALAAAQEAFAWMGSDGRHDESSKRLDGLLPEVGGPRTLVAKLAGHLVSTYPQQQLRWQAEDACRVACSSELADISTLEADQAQHLRPLQSLDPILREDLSRFMARANKNELRIAPVSPPGNRVPVAVEREFSLVGPEGKRDSDIVWFDAAVVNGEVVVAGHRANELLLGMIQNGNSSNREVHCFPPIGHIKGDASAEFPHLVVRRHVGEIEIGFTNEATLETEGPLYFSDETVCSINAKLADDGVDCAVADDGSIWSIDFMYFSCHRDGETLDFEFEWSFPSMPRLSNLVTVGNAPYIGMDQHVFSVVDERGESVFVAQAPIQRLAASLRGTTTRLVIATDASLEMVNTNTGVSEVIDRERSFQHACFLHGGRLAAVSGNELLVFQRNQKHRYQPVANVPLGDASRLPRRQRVVSIQSLSVKKLIVIFDDGLAQTFRLR